MPSYRLLISYQDEENDNQFKIIDELSWEDLVENFNRFFELNQFLSLFHSRFNHKNLYDLNIYQEKGLLLKLKQFRWFLDYPIRKILIKKNHKDEVFNFDDHSSPVLISLEIQADLSVSEIQSNTQNLEDIENFLQNIFDEKEENKKKTQKGKSQRIEDLAKKLLFKTISQENFLEEIKNEI